MNFSEISVQTLISQPFGENSYIAHLNGKSECFVVDPGFGVEEILNFIVEKELKLESVLLTHGHADHIAGLGILKEAWPDCVVYIGEGDNEKLGDSVQNCSAIFGFSLTVPEADILLRGDEKLSVAGIPVEVLHVPGHSKGHVAYLIPSEPQKMLFIGDVILQQSIGRTDFPDGDSKTLRESINTKVLTLPDDTVLFCGHGTVSSIAGEKKYNSAIRQFMNRR